jgi:hypothetical protein
MSFAYNEVIRVGNSSARVKNFYANGLIVLMDIQGEFKAGDTISGDDSGHTYTLNSFEIRADYDTYYDPTIWDELADIAITQDNGSVIVLDAAITGKASQDYQPDYVVVKDT